VDDVKEVATNARLTKELPWSLIQVQNAFAAEKHKLPEEYKAELDEAIRKSKLIVACVSATQAWSMSHAVACKLRCCVPKPKTPSKPEQHAERAL
jgi:hypothetical protein